MGRLFLGNASDSMATLSVNGAVVQVVRPFPKGPPPPPLYTPYFAFASIGRHVEPQCLGYGANTLGAGFSDDGQGAQGWTFPLTFTTRYSLDDDVIAYVFRGWLMPMDGGGRPLADNPSVIPGTPAPPTVSQPIPSTQEDA